MPDDRRSARYLAGVVATASPGGGGIEGRVSTYTISGDDDRSYRCDYTDVVTEGFRTLAPGDSVRFVPLDDGLELRARQVLKLDDLTTAELYGTSGIDLALEVEPEQPRP